MLHDGRTSEAWEPCARASRAPPGTGIGSAGEGPCPHPPCRDEAERRIRRAPQCASRIRVRSLRLSLATRALGDGAHLLADLLQHAVMTCREFRHPSRLRPLLVVVRELFALDLRAQLLRL